MNCRSPRKDPSWATVVRGSAASSNARKQIVLKHRELKQSRPNQYGEKTRGARNRGPKQCGCGLRGMFEHDLPGRNGIRGKLNSTSWKTSALRRGRCAGSAAWGNGEGPNLHRILAGGGVQAHSAGEFRRNERDGSAAHQIAQFSWRNSGSPHCNENPTGFGGGGLNWSRERGSSTCVASSRTYFSL